MTQEAKPDEKKSKKKRDRGYMGYDDDAEEPSSSSDEEEEGREGKDIAPGKKQNNMQQDAAKYHFCEKVAIFLASFFSHLSVVRWLC